MSTFFMIMMLFLMLMFSNMLFYVISLLIISVFVLTHLVAYGFLSVLSLLLILIVYLGAMMILIGYICAVVPNFDLSPSYSFTTLLFLLSVFSLLYLSQQSSPFTISDNQTKLDTLISFFFSEWGLYMFFIIVFMLFFTLLMVTSQYSSPQGPFRST